MMLADMGAEIIRIDRASGRTRLIDGDERLDVTARGRRSLALDLKKPQAVEAVLRLCAGADGLIEGFRLTGYTDFRRLEEAAKTIGGRSLDDCAAVLDWGCGCGRISRYLGERVGSRLTGCDIDADNVGWCRDHLPGRFVVTGLMPPLPFDDGEFDLVIGLSVFTHFRETLQDAWLAELARVTRPGAVLLMTVHGETALDYAHLAPLPDKLARQAVAKAGLLVGSDNNQLDGFADHRGEYVNVFHSTRYIKERWSRHFDVLDVLPGYIFTHDLVVLRKRGDPR